MKIAIINYGMGNLASVFRAFEVLGAQPFIAHEPEALRNADKVVLPGVGAFKDGMQSLVSNGWDVSIRQAVNDEKKPFLGICLGMQMLATTGNEGGECPGLGLIPGRVTHLGALGCEMRVPHVGWNEVSYKEGEPLFRYIPQNSDFYFVHSFAFVADSANHVAATTSYGIDVTAVIASGHIMGCQFHPEKSSKAGRQLLKNFLEYKVC